MSASIPCSSVVRSAPVKAARPVLRGSAGARSAVPTSRPARRSASAAAAPPPPPTGTQAARAKRSGPLGAGQGGQPRLGPGKAGGGDLGREGRGLVQRQRGAQAKHGGKQRAHREPPGLALRAGCAPHPQGSIRRGVGYSRRCQAPAALLFGNTPRGFGAGCPHQPRRRAQARRREERLRRRRHLLHRGSSTHSRWPRGNWRSRHSAAKPAALASASTAGAAR